MARTSKLRGNESFRRKSGRKPPRSITLIVCEGETEQEYFKAARIRYRLTSAEVVLADNTEGPAPISVVRCAEKRCAEPGGYDRIYCVFDRNGHESFARARERILLLATRKQKPLPIEEAISIPCFELWVLLHYRRTDAPFIRCADVIDRIRADHIPSYQKADATICKALMARLNTALEYATWLEGRARDNDSNPYTSVHHAILHFATVAGM